MNQLESALVLILRDTIKWESATVNSTGTLAPVNPALPFDCVTYQCRDRQLAFRDLILGASVIEVAIQVGDVWNFAPSKPSLQGATLPGLTFTGTVAGNLNSQVRHVLNASIPYDAARYADADLYGRDALAYEVLARACAEAFIEPSITVQDSTGTVIPSTAIWSLAQGQSGSCDINAAKALDRDLFKLPDQNLADRDNLLAAYVASLAQVLKNPFASALRLYVQVQSNGTVQREPDIYALVTSDGTNRTFQAEPAVPGMNQIVYNVQAQTLQWFGSEVNAIEVPQIYAITIPGVDAGQTVTTLAQVPSVRDAQYWRSKAGQIQPDGAKVCDTDVFTTDTPNVVIGGLIQTDTASLTVPGQATFELSGTVPAGDCRVSVLAIPCNTVTVDGLRNTSATSGTLTGADFAVNVGSGAIAANDYLVQGGNGIVYAGSTYFAGDVFSGTVGSTGYTQYGAESSTIRQFTVGYGVALPPGTWDFSVLYTNLAGTADGFSINAVYTASGESPVIVLQDLSPIPFTGSNGQLQAVSASIDVQNAAPFDLAISWTGGSGQLHIRQLVFSSDAVAGYYSITGEMFGSSVPLNVNGVSNAPCVLRWETNNVETVVGDLPLTLDYTASPGLPIKLQQVQVQSVGTYATTPLSASFYGFRQECLDRAERVIQQGYAAAVSAYGTCVPTFRDSGSRWSPAATENWMSFVETYNPRLREIAAITALTTGFQYEVTTAPVTYSGTVYGAGQRFYGEDTDAYSGGLVKQVGAFKPSLPGHLGRPVLVPRGLYFDAADSTVKSWQDTPFSTPTIMACQPWMIAQGLYVAQSEFWLPESMDVNTAGATYSSTNNGPPMPVPPPPAPVPLPPVVPPPVVPSGLSATPGDSAVYLSWSASPGAGSYTLYRSTSVFGPYTSFATLGQTVYIDSTVSNGTTYYYEVAATNASATSAASSPVSALPIAANPPPNIPAGVVATPAISQITISYSPSAGAVSYAIYRSRRSGSGYAALATTSGTSYVDTSVNPNSTYYYAVVATNSNGTSGQSAPVSSAAYAPLPTGAQTGMFVNDGGHGALAINWSPNAAGAAWYTVSRSTVSGGPYSLIFSSYGDSLGLDADGYFFIVDSGLSIGTVYYYIITGVSTGGNGPASAEISGTA